MTMREDGTWEPSPTMQVIRRIQRENMATHADPDEVLSMTIALVMYIDALTERGHLPSLTYEEVAL